MRTAWRALVWLVWKDLRTEARSRQFLLAAVAFGILFLLIMGMALNAVPRLPVHWYAGLLWMSSFFATALSMTRHDARDREFDALHGMLVAPMDRSVPYYAKWISTGLFVIVVELAISGAMFIIFNQPLPRQPLVFLGILIGGAAGLTGVGTFLATLTATSSIRDMLLPLTLFPLAIPLFLALVQLTADAFAGSLGSQQVWVEVMIGYVIAFAVLPGVLYEMLLEV